MKKLSILSTIALLFAFAACNNATESENAKKIAELEAKLNEVSPTTPISTTVGTEPAKAAEPEPIDPAIAAVFSFDSETYDFGTVDQGASVEHKFTFTNTGKSPLIIESTQASCGCTVPSHTKDPIPPGETGEIDVKFNTTGKSGAQNKAVTITANTNPRVNKIYIKGEVNVPSKSEGPLKTE